MKQVNMMLDTLTTTESTYEFRFLFFDDIGIKSLFLTELDAAKYEALMSFTTSPLCSPHYPMVRGVYDGGPCSPLIAIGHIFEDQFFELDGSGEIISYRQLIAKHS